MHSEQELFSALRRCQAPKLRCQIDQISTFGMMGLKQDFGSRYFEYVPPKSGPSFTTIERAMNLIFSLAGRFLPPQLKLATKAFKLVYKPHFKVLKMFDQTFERYWDAISYLRWLAATTDGLAKAVREYVFLTGQLDLREVMIYLGPMPPATADRELQRIKSASELLFEFDRALLADCIEWVRAGTAELKKLNELKSAETKVDSIALFSAVREIELLGLNDNMAQTLERLVSHCSSWSRLSQAVYSAPIYRNELREFGAALNRLSLNLSEKASGKK